MESALYIFYSLVVSYHKTHALEGSLVRFMILHNSWIKTVRSHFPWSNLYVYMYILLVYWEHERITENDSYIIQDGRLASAIWKPGMQTRNALKCTNHNLLWLCKAGQSQQQQHFIYTRNYINQIKLQNINKGWYW
jgi:hypothetical protein